MKPEIGYLRDRGSGMELIVCLRSRLSYLLHNHVSVFTLGMVLEGAPGVALGGDPRVYCQGGAFLIPPYLPHSIQARGPYSLLSLCVDKTRAAGRDPEGLREDALALLRGCALEPEADWSGLLELLDCLPALARSLPPEGESPIERVKRALERHPEDRLSVDEMAARAFASKYDLVRAFKREVGLTPHQFQLQNRVRKAQRLLEQAGSVAEAALDAGFFDQSHLVKQFKRAVGLTPADYRAACGRLPALSAVYTKAGRNLANR